MSSRKVNVSTYIMLTDFEKLERISRTTGKSVSGLVREIIEKHLEGSG